MAKPLEGRSYIITGSGRGIGREVALLVGKLGGNVVVVDPGVNVDGSGNDAGPAQSVADEINAAGGTAVASLESVATVEGGEAMIKTAMDKWGRIDGVVHVAGILRDRMVFNMAEEEWDAVIATHLTGFFNVVKPASIIMRQARYGRIIGFSSGSGMNGNAGQANYGAAKAGITGGVRVAAKDLGRYGITANAICPAANTRMTQSIPDAARDLRARAGIANAAPASPAPAAAAAAPAPVFRGPEFVAPIVAYLLTDQAWNINGKVFHTAGGNVSLGYDETPFRTIVKPGMWTVDELKTLVPGQLMQGLQNPAPPPPDLDLPGRPVNKAS